MVHDPGHPDADADGYVAYPNVNVLEEMVDLMTTRKNLRGQRECPRDDRHDGQHGP